MERLGDARSKTLAVLSLEGVFGCCTAQELPLPLFSQLSHGEAPLHFIFRFEQKPQALPYTRFVICVDQDTVSCVDMESGFPQRVAAVFDGILPPRGRNLICATRLYPLPHRGRASR